MWEGDDDQSMRRMLDEDPDDVASHYERDEDDPVVDLLQQSTAEELWLMVGRLDQWAAAAKRLKPILEEYLRRDIKVHGAIRLGDAGYYSGIKTTRKLIDPEGLIGWLGEDAAEAFNPNTAKITAVRAIADRRYREIYEVGWGEDPEALDNWIAARVGAVEDSFYERVTDDEGEPVEVLKSAPASRTKWVQALGQGERRG
jgi:hypothetical protein